VNGWCALTSYSSAVQGQYSELLRVAARCRHIALVVRQLMLSCLAALYCDHTHSNASFKRQVYIRCGLCSWEFSVTSVLARVPPSILSSPQAHVLQCQWTLACS
jgi:hypothetical protein